MKIAALPCACLLLAACGGSGTTASNTVTPLLQEGDIAYVDNSTPQPGDVVQFADSAASAQRAAWRAAGVPACGA